MATRRRFGGPGSRASCDAGRSSPGITKPSRRRTRSPQQCSSSSPPNLSRPTDRMSCRNRIGGFWRLSQQQLGELLVGVGEAEALARSVIEFVGDGVELELGDGGEVEALGEV